MNSKNEKQLLEENKELKFELNKYKVMCDELSEENRLLAKQMVKHVPIMLRLIVFIRRCWNFGMRVLRKIKKIILGRNNKK